MTTEYKAMQKEWKARRAKAVKMHAAGKNMQEIGDALGVTRQRVRAILIKEGVRSARS